MNEHEQKQQEAPKPPTRASVAQDESAGVAAIRYREQEFEVPQPKMTHKEHVALLEKASAEKDAENEKAFEEQQKEAQMPPEERTKKQMEALKGQMEAQAAADRASTQQQQAKR